MTDIDKVRERLNAAAELYEGLLHSPSMAPDLRALLADHAQLQADAERLEWLEGFVHRAYVHGVSFDFSKSCEGEPGGFRFMTRHCLDARQPTLRAAIDAARRR